MCLYSSVEDCKQKKNDEQKKMNRRKIRKIYKASSDSVFWWLKKDACHTHLQLKPVNKRNMMNRRT